MPVSLIPIVPVGVKVVIVAQTRSECYNVQFVVVVIKKCKLAQFCQYLSYEAGKRTKTSY